MNNKTSAEPHTDDCQCTYCIPIIDDPTLTDSRTVASEYDTENGIIRSPGKFESEPVYAPYFYDSLLNGFADEDENGVATFIVTDEDRKLFPMLAGTKSVRLWESDQGFVHTY